MVETTSVFRRECSRSHVVQYYIHADTVYTARRSARDGVSLELAVYTGVVAIRITVTDTTHTLVRQSSEGVFGPVCENLPSSLLTPHPENVLFSTENTAL